MSLSRKTKSLLPPDRLTSLGHVESWAASFGLLPVLGVDEAGRGCLAGPVVAAAVMLPDDADIPGLNDSKLITPERRVALDSAIKGCARAFGIGVVDAGRIDEINILRATLEAMKMAVEAALETYDGKVGIVIVDGNQVIPGIVQPQKAWPKGDRLSRSVAAASIVAKVYRDHLMEQLDALHPGYGFAVHKGYGTRSHISAIKRLGPSPVHRISFAPLKK